MNKKALAVFLGAMTALPAIAASLVIDTGWTYDQVDSIETDSQDSPIELNLASPAYFRVTDQFVPGDHFVVYDGASLIMSSSLDGAHTSITPVGDSNGDGGWTSADYEHGEVLLTPGLHTLHVQESSGQPPAGFYIRLDSASVPDAAGTLPLLGLGLAGVFGLRRRLS